MKGQHGTILIVDLSEQSFRTEHPEESVYRTYLGGKGLASYLLHRHNPPGVDPLGPDNRIIFATGPAAGSSVWGGCRYGVYTKSPQTKLYAESYSGGRVPEAIDATGFDAIIIHGRCDGPTVLEITPNGAHFHDGREIWGQETYQAEEMVMKRFSETDAEHTKSGVVTIGPAAENLVRFGVIKNDRWRSAGRTGVGTVLGAKKVKAVLFRGNRKRPLFDEAATRALAKKTMVESKDNAGVLAYKTMGTSQLVKVLNGANAFPTRYWSEGKYDQWEKIGADALHSKCQVKPNACLKCFMACGRKTTIREGRHAGMEIEGPEYETIYAFGGLCLIDSIEEIAYLNDICDRLGVDTITAGNLCAFAIEAYKRGKTDYPMEYGDVDAIAELLQMIARRQGIGDILAEGIVQAAKTWGLEDIAVHVKGMEPAGYDPRVLKGMGLAYATSDRGACHLRATFYKPELAQMIPPAQIEGKAALFIEFEDRLTIFDTLILCRFYRDLYTWEVLGDMIHNLTGLSGSKEELQGIAASISNLIRSFNIREGMTEKDEWLPKKLFEKMDKTDHAITEDELRHMLADYYRLRGWSEEGLPG